ncbi:metabotropic glutamate receptor 3-like isoform X1 [Asterias rubens]|uniref:metabotropic glutamate receptor 3-like isoform X1 n=1 Tax=Asterias rubens TaxID=7604 RepID=UPI001454F2A7|nr:metabotropic glutamate receptor 3-like isoform X1 [Asterias rubens]
MNSILLRVISVWCAIYSSCQAYSSHGSDFVHINPSVILTFSENLTHNSQDNIEAFGFPRTPRTTDDRPKTRHRRNAANLPTGLAGEEEGGTVNAPSQIFAYKKGDFNIGGMFAVRFPDPKYTDPCSRVLTLTGLRIESMLYAIDFINNSTDILPGVELGFEIRDDCSNKNRALREALSFVSTTGGGACPDEAQTVGVVGTGSSSTSGPVANLLGLFKVPQVSYSATSSLLSNKKLYPYFMRTVASDVNQAAVMADLAEDMNWNYVMIIHTDDAYGTPGMEHLSTLLEARNVCIAHTFSLRSESRGIVADNIVQTLLDEPEISVIFTFCQKTDILRVLNEAFNRGLLDRTWIASDSWGQSSQTVQDVEPVVRGMLGIIPKSSPYEKFQSYLAELDPYTNQRNPWYQLTLGEQFNCTFDPSSLLRKPCTGTETFAQVEDTHARFVIDAVLALAYGLNNMISECQDCHGNVQIDGEAYLDYVRNVNFTGVTNPNFKFDEDGDPLAQYEIHNLQEHGREFSFVRVADWDPVKKFTEWKDVVWQAGTTPPLSRCSPDCPAGNFITLQTHKCCWKCYPCEGISISTSQNSMQCTSCKDGERVNANRTVCLVNPVIYLQWKDPVAIVFSFLTSIGLIVTGFSLLVYIQHRNSATIKATSTELSYLLLLGIAMNYCCTFLFIATPTDIICSAKILVMGASFSVYVGALLTKTNRISRIFNRKLSDGAPSMFLNIQYQLMFAFGIVAIQIALQVIWFQVEPGVAALDYSDPEFTLLQCQYSSYLGPSVAIGYNAILAMLCLYKAFRTRKLPGQFNDSRGICFAMLTCCLIWFIFFASYFTTTGIANSIICSTAFLSCGTSGLICMFLPKLWIVLMRPERNVRQSTLKMKSSLGSHVTINTVSGAVTNNKAKKNDGLSLKPDPSDMKASSSHSSEGDGDNLSQISNENDDQKFLEEIKILEQDLQEAEMERDDAVAMANEKYQQMIELQKSQEDELLEIDKEIQLEKTSLRELLKNEGMLDDEIDGIVAMEINSNNEEGNDWNEKIKELVFKLDAVSSERDTLDKQVQELKLECQHWKQIMSQSVQETSHNDTEVEGLAEDISTTKDDVKLTV